MLMPKRVKYRKVQRGRMTGVASRGNKVVYGEYGIQAMEPGWITGNQIEAARIAMTRYTKRGGKVWIKIFPDKPITKKALGVRMGSGKGAPETWVAVVKNQKVMFEIGGVSEELAREVAGKLGIALREGVYCWMNGPTYESPAEIRMARILGGDAVGMSTVPETIVCNYMGMKVLAVSCITNMATGIQSVKHSHARVLEIAERAGETMSRWLAAVIEKM